MPQGYRGDGKVVTAWLPTAVSDRFREIAAAEEITISKLSRRLIEDYIARHDAEHTA